MDKSIVLQILNGYIATTALCASYIFVRYFVNNTALGYENLRPAIALGVLCFFEVMLRFPEFVARTIANMGIAISQPNVTLIIGGAGVELGFLCICRVFSPRKWGVWSWVVPTILSTIIVGISLLFVKMGE